MPATLYGRNPDTFRTFRPVLQTRPARLSMNTGRMVTHVAYMQEQYRTPDECLRGIREHVDHGWQISQIRGAQGGPFVVLFRMEDSL